jgi:hypothetical protein
LVTHPLLIGLLDKRARVQLKGAEIPPPAVFELLEKGRMEAGARLFYETVVRAGRWDERPAEMRERWIFNASTFLDEERDPDARRVDLGALSHFRQPTLRATSACPCSTSWSRCWRACYLTQSCE